MWLRPMATILILFQNNFANISAKIYVETNSKDLNIPISGSISGGTSTPTPPTQNLPGPTPSPAQGPTEHKHVSTKTQPLCGAPICTKCEKMGSPNWGSCAKCETGKPNAPFKKVIFSFFNILFQKLKTWNNSKQLLNWVQICLRFLIFVCFVVLLYVKNVMILTECVWAGDGVGPGRFCVGGVGVEVPPLMDPDMGIFKSLEFVSTYIFAEIFAKLFWNNINIVAIGRSHIAAHYF